MKARPCRNCDGRVYLDYLYPPTVGGLGGGGAEVTEKDWRWVHVGYETGAGADCGNPEPQDGGGGGTMTVGVAGGLL